MCVGGAGTESLPVVPGSQNYPYFYGFSSAEMAECATGSEEATQTGMQAPSAVTW